MRTLTPDDLSGPPPDTNFVLWTTLEFWVRVSRCPHNYQLRFWRRPVLWIPILFMMCIILINILCVCQHLSQTSLWLVGAPHCLLSGIVFPGCSWFSSAAIEGRDQGPAFAKWLCCHKSVLVVLCPRWLISKDLFPHPKERWGETPRGKEVGDGVCDVWVLQEPSVHVPLRSELAPFLSSVM